jgi:hypothetical protein
MKALFSPWLTLAVPTGKDQLHWNIHRVYGRARLPLLLSSWKVEGIFGDEHFDSPSLRSTDRDRRLRLRRLCLEDTIITCSVAKDFLSGDDGSEPASMSLTFPLYSTCNADISGSFMPEVWLYGVHQVAQDGNRIATLSVGENCSDFCLLCPLCHEIRAEMRIHG